MVREAFPSVEMVRMVSSGTEAVMSAIRLARAATGRDDIVKFEGCYHGHSDQMLVKAGSGALTLGMPDSPGVPADLAKHTLNLPYNDLEAVRRLLRARKGKIAAVIVEPVAANAGVILPKEGFLQGLRQVTAEHGALLIFDEVITGFRLALGGAQEYYGVRPDLTCLGKIIGGGLPVGAYGGRRDLMAQVAPSGPVYQAGTLSGNPLAMAAGHRDPLASCARRASTRASSARAPTWRPAPPPTWRRPASRPSRTGSARSRASSSPGRPSSTSARPRAPTRKSTPATSRACSRAASTSRPPSSRPRSSRWRTARRTWTARSPSSAGC